LEELRSKYELRKREIRSRLSEFSRIMEESDERVFAELAFCICTPQSKATLCWKAIESLVKNGLLYNGSSEQIKPFLNAVRFNDHKSRYIVAAREFFTDGSGISIKRRILSLGKPFEMRDWLIENVKGLGPKEASHFLRNIGLGSSLAILDSHILKNLVKYGVIDEFPKSLTHSRYYEIEEKMRDFASRTGIPMDELDLLLWSEETGIIFK
jgi:N-glycosylase/DNA lyase